MSIKQVYLRIFLLFILLDKNYGQQNKISKSKIPPPPFYWTAHWFEQPLSVTRVYLDDHVAGYVAEDVDSSVSWPFEHMSKVWKYVKNVYGSFGPDQHLYVILHSREGKYNGGHPSYYFRQDHDFKNVIELGISDKSMWAPRNKFAFIYRITGRAGFIVEFANKQTEGSPGYNLWGRSEITMWSQIFIYDILSYLGFSHIAEEYLRSAQRESVDFPREGTYWMRDWFLPIYQKAGRRVLNDFFELTYAHYPRVYKSSGSSGDLPHFEYIGGGMNMGELVHFWSAAAHTSLKSDARNAFGWTDEYEEQFQQARNQYPALQYSCLDCRNITREGQGEAITKATVANTTATVQLTVSLTTTISPTTSTDSTPTFILTTDSEPVSEDGRNAAVTSSVTTETKSTEKEMDNDNTTWIVVSIAILLVTVLVLAIVLLISRLKIRTLRKQIRELTTKEVKEFFEGSGKLGKDERNNESIHAMPFDKNYEVPLDKLVIAHDQVLGSGQFGLVLRGFLKKVEGSGENEMLPIAIKTVKKDVEVEFFKALLMELKVMAYLGKHENIASLLGACTTNIKNREIYVALELCENGDLKNFLIKNRKQFKNIFALSEQNLQHRKNSSCAYLQLETTKIAAEYSKSAPNQITTLNLLQWTKEITTGMAYLAEKQVIHGDLAARNVLLTRNFEAKVSDFGLSRQLVNYSTYLKTQVTPLPWKWMSIEALKDMIFSTQSDVWSFGVTMWEIFTLGETPYPGWTWDYDFADKLVAGSRLQAPSNANQEIYNLMCDCWKLQPDERPSFADIVQQLNDIASSVEYPHV